MRRNRLTDIFYPERCCGCDKIIPGGMPVCEKCAEIIFHPSEKKSRCETCFLPRKECICSQHLYYEKLAVPFFNEGTVRKTIHKMKFSGRTDLIKPYARMIKNALDERDMLLSTDIITYIPMSRFSEFRRGYNQAKLLAEDLSELTGIKCIPLFNKAYKTKTQHSLGRINRTGNLLGVYEPIKQNIDIIKDKTVLIADDIVTTGNTVNEAAKTLLIFGAERVYVCACAATKHKK